jgi:hypothetical protein
MDTSPVITTAPATGRVLIHVVAATAVRVLAHCTGRVLIRATVATAVRVLAHCTGRVLIHATVATAVRALALGTVATEATAASQFTHVIHVNPIYATAVTAAAATTTAATTSTGGIVTIQQVFVLFKLAHLQIIPTKSVRLFCRLWHSI